MSQKIDQACLKLAFHIADLESSGDEELTWLKYELGSLLRDVPTTEELSVNFEDYQRLKRICPKPLSKMKKPNKNIRGIH